MLIFTNREILSSTGAQAFTRQFSPGSSKLGAAKVVRGTPSKGGAWRVSDIHTDVDDGDAIRLLHPIFAGSRPVLIYIHGNNNSPATCFERCCLLESMYEVEVVGFSWASEGYLSNGSTLPSIGGDASDSEECLADIRNETRGQGVIQAKIRRYRQAKDNAQDSVDALARFLRMVGTARLYGNRQPYSLVAHSLGVHFLQYTLGIQGVAESLAITQNIALIAACARASGHKDWLGRISPRGQLFVIFNESDIVLAGAAIADGPGPNAGQTKLGLNPGEDLLRVGSVRYVSFTNAKTSPTGHQYFVRPKMYKKSRKLFGRVFSSQPDIQQGEDWRDAYIGCDSDLRVCYMGRITKKPDLLT